MTLGVFKEKDTTTCQQWGEEEELGSFVKVVSFQLQPKHQVSISTTKPQQDPECLTDTDLIKKLHLSMFRWSNEFVLKASRTRHINILKVFMGVSGWIHNIQEDQQLQVELTPSTLWASGRLVTFRPQGGALTPPGCCSAQQQEVSGPGSSQRQQAQVVFHSNGVLMSFEHTNKPIFPF